MVAPSIFSYGVNSVTKVVSYTAEICDSPINLTKILSNAGLLGLVCAFEVCQFSIAQENRKLNDIYNEYSYHISDLSHRMLLYEACYDYDVLVVFS